LSFLGETGVHHPERFARRRLARDYETLPASSEAMIYIASIDSLTKRITDETTPTWRGTY
jgi:hypothetical protein